MRRIAHGVVLWDGYGELALFFLVQSHEVGSETREGKDVVLVGDVFDILVVNHDFAVDFAVDIEVEAIAEFGGAFDGFPNGLLFLEAGDNVVNLFIADFHGFGFDADGAIVAEIYSWFQGDGGGEGDGFEFGDLDAGLAKGGDFLFSEHFIEVSGTMKSRASCSRAVRPTMLSTIRRGALPRRKPGMLMRETVRR